MLCNYKDGIKFIDNLYTLCYNFNTHSQGAMINLDEKYHSYLKGEKKLRIDGVEEKVVAYGYTDDGSSIDGYYLTTRNYRLNYTLQGIFVKMTAIHEMAEVF